MGCCGLHRIKEEVRPQEHRPADETGLKKLRLALQDMKKTDAVPALALESNPLHLKRIHQSEASEGSVSHRSRHNS